MRAAGWRRCAAPCHSRTDILLPAAAALPPLIVPTGEALPPGSRELSSCFSQSLVQPWLWGAHSVDSIMYVAGCKHPYLSHGLEGDEPNVHWGLSGVDASQRRPDQWQAGCQLDET